MEHMFSPLSSLPRSIATRNLCTNRYRVLGTFVQDCIRTRLSGGFSSFPPGTHICWRVISISARAPRAAAGSIHIPPAPHELCRRPTLWAFLARGRAQLRNSRRSGVAQDARGSASAPGRRSLRRSAWRRFSSGVCNGPSWMMVLFATCEENATVAGHVISYGPFEYGSLIRE